MSRICGALHTGRARLEACQHELNLGRGTPAGASEKKGGRRGYSLWAPTSHPPGASTRALRNGEKRVGGGTQLQSNRSDGGGRGAYASVGSPRWVRILRITMGSSMVATTRMRPPQWGQASTSTENVWRVRASHNHRRGAGGGGRPQPRWWPRLDLPPACTPPGFPPFPTRTPRPGSRCRRARMAPATLIFLDRRCVRRHRSASLRICIDKDIAWATRGTDMPVLRAATEGQGGGGGSRPARSRPPAQP